MKHGCEILGLCRVFKIVDTYSRQVKQDECGGAATAGVKLYKNERFENGP
jgi:hypothetical protein